MGKLGFLFKTEADFTIVFVEHQSVLHDVVIGFEQFLPKEHISKKLSADLNMEVHPILGTLRYSKISLSDRTHLDFEQNLFWFNPLSYKNVRSLLTQTKNDEQIVQNTLDLHTIFF